MTAPLQLFAPYRSRSAGRLRAAKVCPIANYERITDSGIISNTKPFGGFWTFTYTPHSPSASDWLRFCRDEHADFIPAYGYLYRVADHARVYTIATVADIDRLLEKYHGRYCQGIDFEAVNKDYDAIHLSVTIPQVLFHPYMMYWDSECTLWFDIGVLSYQGRIQIERESVPPHPVET